MLTPERLTLFAGTVAFLAWVVLYTVKHARRAADLEESGGRDGWAAWDDFD